MERNDIEASINAAYAEKNSETSKMEMFALNKILLVEDDIHISEVIHDYFVRESGGQMYVEVAYNGDDGLDRHLILCCLISCCQGWMVLRCVVRCEGTVWFQYYF